MNARGLFVRGVKHIANVLLLLAALAMLVDGAIAGLMLWATIILASLGLLSRNHATAIRASITILGAFLLAALSFHWTSTGFQTLSFQSAQEVLGVHAIPLGIALACSTVGFLRRHC